MQDTTATGALNPFPAPSFGALPSIDASGVLSVAFLVVFSIWVLYTVVSAYHWFRYSHKSWIAVPALAIHVFVSGFLLLFIMSAFQ